MAKGIQMTLFEYFSDVDQFSLGDAKECVFQYADKKVKEPSIRARIYEGINKGLFQRVAKGVYTVTKKNAEDEDITCMLIQGNGRDLSFITDNSIDAIITDHPYLLKNSLKGGNRDFASYDLFQYSQQDMDEKYRVLKKGHFLVEFLPEENGDNYEYLHQVKAMAKESGFDYYAKVPWKKGNFIANTGRKAKNTEDILFFSKGRARDMRPDAKKDKAEPEVKHYMSGGKGMLPTVFDVQLPPKTEKIHQSEKPVELLKQIIEFVTEEKEWILDQFAGSFALGEAALDNGRNSICVEINEAYFEKGKQRIYEIEGESMDKTKKIGCDGESRQGKFTIDQEDRILDNLIDMFDDLRLDGMRAEFKNGKLFVRDNEGRWQGKGIYRFILRDCLAFNESGIVEGVRLRQKSLAGFLKDAQVFGLKLTEAEKEAIKIGERIEISESVQKKEMPGYVRR